MKNVSIVAASLLLIILLISCRDQSNAHAGHEAAEEVYTCPMHPQIVRNKPGSCPICGMDLVKKETEGKRADSIDLESLLKPTNEFVISSIPITTLKQSGQPMEIEALGTVAYDTRQIGSISSRVAGRIEKLYVRYRYQKISKGQRILDIYSPELLTAQQNLLFLLKNDASNKTMIDAARQKLRLLGMSAQQLQKIENTGKADYTVSVFSNYSGHLYDAGSSSGMNNTSAAATGMAAVPLTQQLSIKEGMYVEKGQSIFNVYNLGKTWALLNIFAGEAAMIKKGQPVKIVSETSPDKSFSGEIDFIEPFYRESSRTLTARVYFDNAKLKIPIGSQVRAVITGNRMQAAWLPREAVISLGMNKVVFKKIKNGFAPQKVNTGAEINNQIQITGGLEYTDSVAVNAQYLTDSESFIKIN